MTFIEIGRVYCEFYFPIIVKFTIESNLSEKYGVQINEDLLNNRSH